MNPYISAPGIGLVVVLVLAGLGLHVKFPRLRPWLAAHKRPAAAVLVLALLIAFVIGSGLLAGGAGLLLLALGSLPAPERPAPPPQTGGLPMPDSAPLRQARRPDY